MKSKIKALENILADLSTVDYELAGDTIVRDYLAFAEDHSRHENDIKDYLAFLTSHIDASELSTHKEVSLYLPLLMHKVHSIAGDYTKWVEWWGFAHYPSVYYQVDSDESNSRKEIPVLEKICNHYGDLIIDQLNKRILSYNVAEHRQKIDDFILFLTDLVRHHIGHMWSIPNYLAQLLILTRKPKDASSYFKKLLLMHPRRFWLWYPMGDIVEASGEDPVPYYAMALRPTHNPMYLLDIRYRFIELLMAQGKYKEAADEIRVQLNYKVHLSDRMVIQLNKWTKADWYAEHKSTVKSVIDQRPYYLEKSNAALEQLFGIGCIRYLVVFRVIRKNKVAYCSDDDYNTYKIYYGEFVNKLRPSNVIRVCIKEKGESYREFDKLYFLEKVRSNNIRYHNLTGKVEGEIKLFNTKNGTAGMVEGAFINEFLVETLDLQNNELISAKVCKSGRRKGKETWVVTKIKKRKNNNGNHT